MVLFPRMLRRVVSPGLVAPLLLAALPGQRPAPAPRSQRLIEVTAAAANESVSCSANYQHGVAVLRDGALFVLVPRATYANAERTGTAVSEAELWRSDDGGLHWRRAAVLPTDGDGDGALAADGDRLAIAWTSSNGTPFGDVYWQRFDPAADRFVGTPEVLTRATGDQDQYYVTDLVRTAGGALVVAIGSHRAPPAPWTCGWSTALRWLPNGAAQWRPLQQVNVAYYGTCGSMLVRGELVDFVYRTNPGSAVHGLRTFDTQKGAFVQDRDERAMVEPTADNEITNVAVPCIDGTGGRTVLHVLAAEQPGKGRLAISFARPGQEWRTTSIADDPDLIAGNENPVHFALARGPGNQVFCYFSKKSEAFAHLWQCVLEDGVAAVPPRRVASGDEGAFLTITGMRLAEAFSGLHVAVIGRTASRPGGVVSVFGSFPARSVFARQD